MRKKNLSKITQAAHDVIKEYRRLGSIKAVAATLQISEGKVRKILITENEIEYERTAQAMVLLKYGKSLAEIAYSLGVTEKVLNNYLPYSKGEYMAEKPSENALRIRKHRQNMRKRSQSEE